jgi:hypothetical protein
VDSRVGDPNISLISGRAKIPVISCGAGN